MPEPVFYFRGVPTFMTRGAADPAMIADLKAIGTLTEEQVDALTVRFSAADGFLDPRRTKALIVSVLSDDEPVAAVQRAIQNLNEEDISDVLNSIESQRKQSTQLGIDDSQMAAIRRNLTKLTRPYPALKRFEKASRLSTLTGQRLETFDLICDLRPIFDDSRKKIEGMMPYTRLRVVATGADGLPLSFEAELSAKQLNELTETASKAQAKLATLRQAISVWITDGIPELPLTRAPQQEPNNA